MNEVEQWQRKQDLLATVSRHTLILAVVDTAISLSARSDPRLSPQDVLRKLADTDDLWGEDGDASAVVQMVYDRLTVTGAAE